MNLKRRQTNKQLVITLHGIRTFAPWQKDLSDELGKAGFRTKSLQYGYFSGLKLIRTNHRKKQLEWFRDQYTLIRKEYPDTVPSIIAHSFGTYIIAKALEAFDGIKFDQVILCGSIIPQDFDWQALFGSGQVKRILNEGAKKDIVVQAAPYFIRDAGASGVYGFDQADNTHLCQRFIDKFGHSDYLHVLNFTENWFPFLKGSNPPKDRPSLNKRFNWRFWLVRITLLLFLIGFVIAGVALMKRLKNPSKSLANNMNEQFQELVSQNKNNNSNAYSYTPPKQQKQKLTNPGINQLLSRYLDQARKLSKQGDYKGAIIACSKALKIDPENTLAKTIRDEAIYADEHYNSQEKK